MTRTAIRHTLCVLAAIALVTAFASSPVSAKKRPPSPPPVDYTAGLGMGSTEVAPKGLAAKKGSQRSRSIAETNAQATIQAAKQASE